MAEEGQPSTGIRCNCEKEEKDKHLIDLMKILKNAKAKHEFREFLKTYQQDDVSLVLASLKCYEIAEGILRSPKNRCNENIDQLKKQLDNNRLVWNLEKVVSLNCHGAFISYLRHIIFDCKRKIEADNVFRQYLKEAEKK